MKHHFEIEIAQEHGILCAVILDNLIYWTAKNKANDMNFYDGRYWVYNSVKAWQELFPYASTKQIRMALDKLLSSGLIVKGNYNKLKMDRTLWYSVNEEAVKCICHTQQNDLSYRTNGFVPSDKAIPISKPNSKPNSKQIPPISPKGEVSFDIPSHCSQELKQALRDWAEYKASLPSAKQFKTQVGWNSFVKQTLNKVNACSEEEVIDRICEAIGSNWQGTNYSSMQMKPKRPLTRCEAQALENAKTGIF